MNWFTDEEKRAIIAATPIWIAWVVAIVMAVGMVWSDCRKSLCDTECETITTYVKYPPGG
jgi:hypothetical protein